jgi:phosphate transport system substrate-binding protein
MRYLLPVSFLTFLIVFACSESTINLSENASSSVMIKGSDTELDLVRSMVKRFQEINNKPANKFMVLGGGSISGINALINGDIELANASRKITEDEIERAYQNGVDPGQLIIAVDAIAVITNPNLGIDSLSMFEVRDIFSGNITNWKDVGGPDADIHVYGRDTLSGTYDFIKNKVIRGDYTNNMKMRHNTNEIIQDVQSDLLGIGYVGVASLIDDQGTPSGKVWATYLYIEGGRACSPFEFRSIETGDYPLIRPLFQYFDRNKLDRVQRLLEFELSAKGQQIVRETGYFPINDFHRQINAESGFQAFDRILL